MVVFAFIALIINIRCRTKRFLPVTCLAFVYSLINCTLSFFSEHLSGTVFMLLSKLVVLLVILLLIVTIFCFRKETVDGRSFAKPMFFCAGMTATQIVGEIITIVNAYDVMLTGKEEILPKALLATLTVLDVVHLILAVGMMICIINALKKSNRET